MIKFLNSKNLLSIFIFAAGVFVSYSIIVQAQAPNIVYPVKELGNCGNETDCKTYCDNPDNMSVCVAFAEKHNLLPKEEIAKAKAFIKSGKTGPGGCKGRNECEAFCNNLDNMDVCLNFAKDNGLMAKDEFEQAQKFVKAVKGGARPPGNCRGKNECENFCNNPDNMEECLAFAEKSEMIPRAELEEAKKAAKAIKSGINPPGNCRGKKECEAYCSDNSHMEECLAFAEKAGFIPPEEVERARKMIPLMKAGKMPGGCRGKDECESYCADESHMEECSNFALEAGLMKPEEAEMFRKTRGRGPGGCRGKEQCESFCNNPENQGVCFNFAKEHNLIPPEEIEKMKSGMEQMRQMMRPMGPDRGNAENSTGPEGRGMGMPPEISQCLKSTVGEEVLNKVQSGQMMPSMQLGEQMRKCFEQFMPVGGPGEATGGPDGRVMDGKMMPPKEMMPYEEGRGQMIKPRDFDRGTEQERMIPSRFKEEFKGKMPPEFNREQMEMMEKMRPERIQEGFSEDLKNIKPEQMEQFKQMMEQREMPQQFNQGFQEFNSQMQNTQSEQFKNQPPQIPLNVLPYSTGQQLAPTQ